TDTTGEVIRAVKGGHYHDLQARGLPWMYCRAAHLLGSGNGGAEPSGGAESRDIETHSQELPRDCSVAHSPGRRAEGNRRLGISGLPNIVFSERDPQNGPCGVLAGY